MIDKRILTGLGFMFVLLLIVAIVLLFGKSKTVTTDLNLYYVNPTQFKLEKRVVTIEGEGDINTALTLLFSGIEDTTVENLFPADIKFNGSNVDEENETLIVDISTNVLSVNYGVEVNYLYIMSIVNTVSDFTGYETVRLTFDGNIVEFFNNGLFIGQPLKRDDSVVK
jgi:spore germination protein GerM